MKQAKNPRLLLAVLLAVLIVGSLPSFGGDKTSARCEMCVPYVQQTKNYCGPAALACVLQYWGLAVDQKTIGKSVFDSSLQATNGADMLLYARGKGYSAYSWNSSLSDLKEKLALGIPVIILQDSSSTDTSGHYRVATGFDDKAGVVFINDPYEPDTKSMPYGKFETLWDRHGNWSLLVCTKDRDAFKQELDEKNPVVHIDLAYIYCKRGDLGAAERESRLALALEPANYSAKNLLAQATRGARSKTEQPKSSN